MMIKKFDPKTEKSQMFWIHDKMHKHVNAKNT